MLPPAITPLPHSRVELKFLVTPEDAKPYLDQAVEDLSIQKPIKGFRSGKATYHDVKNAYGEMLIWKTALDRIVRAQYVKAVLDNDIETIGSPEIIVEKLVPHQDIAFTLTASVMPTVTDLFEYSQPLVTKKIHKVAEEDVNRAIQDLRKARHTEAAVNRAATKEDAVVIDLEMTKENVLIEGGNARDYKVYLAESHVIPCFADQLIGLTKGTVKTFMLEFPKNHYTKNLAGTKVAFTVTVKEVYEMSMPELNDAFAQGFGQDSLAALRDLLRKNLQDAQDKKSDEAAEIELLEKIVQGSHFSEIPKILINEEVQRMIHELKQSTEQQGMKMEDYLASIKKSIDDLTLDFVPRAIERIQTAVLVKEIGKRENVEVPDDEIEAEQDRILDSLPKSETETRKRIASPEYRDILAVQMKNRKVLALLKSKAVHSA
ncbi:MAG: trigger factor [Patescibacteria group bacterium]|mgnify:FL=1